MHLSLLKSSISAIKQTRFQAITLFLLPFMALANPVSQQTAQNVALNFWNAHCDKYAPQQNVPMQLLSTPQWDAFYLFAPAQGEGFVIVAAEDCIEPVLAYSFSNSATRGDSLGPQMSWWLNGWQQQINWCRSRQIAQTPEISQHWHQLTYGDITPSRLTAIEPMVTTKWDQDEPYNALCPSTSGWFTMRAATGCVATAMAQVMKYWNYPEHGNDTHSYYSYSMSGWSDGFGTQFVDFGATTYDWENMPDTLRYNSSDAEIEAVATLMYHCGVATDMMYGTAWEGGSGAYIHNIPLLYYNNTLNGMINYFGYSSNARGLERSNFDDSTWTAMVRAELDAHRPVIYAGGDETSGGHCFVCHGYDDQNRFCFNWGWSGRGDGYFLLTNLAPGLGGTGGGTGTYNFSNNQQILIGVQPPTGNDTFCIIRQFPYTENFEEAATCWSATTTSNQTYSWLIYDTLGCDGNYSAFIFPPDRGESEDHLLSPIIITPGIYSVSWQGRAFSDSSKVDYTFAVDTIMLTVSDTSSWGDHTILFTIAEGDTARIDFGWSGNNTSVPLIIDNITIAPFHIVDIDHVSQIDISLYPNPTTGVVSIECEDAVQNIILLDISGRKLLKTTAKTVDLTTLPKGVYLLSITTENGHTVKKVIKR